MDTLEKYALRVLEARGLNPVKSSIMSKVNAIFWTIVDGTFVITILMELVSNTSDIFTFVDNFSAITVASQVVTKEIGLLTHQQEFRTVITCLKEFWPKDKFGKQVKAKLDNIESFSKRFLQIYICSVACAVSLYMLKPILEGNKILPIMWVTFCSLEESLYCYIFNYILQVVWAACGLHMLVGFDCLFILLLLCGYCELEQIKHALISLDPDETTDEDDAPLLDLIASLIEQHNRVLNLLKRIQDLLGSLLLLQFVATLLSLCASLFVLTSVDFPPSLPVVSKSLPYIFSVFTQNLIYCVAGQVISDQTLSVADAAYASKWWIKAQPQLRRMILLMILRSQRPEEMTAGGVFALNLETFVAIMKTTGSALAFMNTVYGEEE
uniref:Odorant receptor n=1 Tax=Anomala corpulenta TaxID=931571 RepID=A0A0E3U366_9SCAR|nr:odorant receptor 21 [Anomala corpulenta]